MVYRTSQLSEAINRYLSELSVALANANSVNLTNLNIHCERLFKQLLNCLHGISLQNINITEPNAASIDLGDTGARVAVQVTAGSDVTKKVKHTCTGHAHEELLGPHSHFDGDIHNSA